MHNRANQIRHTERNEKGFPTKTVSNSFIYKYNLMLALIIIIKTTLICKNIFKTLRKLLKLRKMTVINHLKQTRMYYPLCYRKNSTFYRSRHISNLNCMSLNFPPHLQIRNQQWHASEGQR